MIADSSEYVALHFSRIDRVIRTANTWRSLNKRNYEFPAHVTCPGLMSDDINGVVIHVTSGTSSEFRQALRNLSNLYDDASLPIPPDLITVVVNGDAVRYLRATAPEASQLTQLIGTGVHIYACERSLSRLGYEASELVDGIDTVSSGVAEVVRLQWNGHGYLKLP